MIRACQEQLLVALAKLHFLTVVQLARLYYSKRSTSYVHALLNDLSKQGYVERFYVALESTRHWGSNPLVYTLSHRGVAALAERGITAFQTHHQTVKTA